MLDASNRRGLMLAAPASGNGKTVLTLALLRALKRKGVSIGAAKAGPDYIDPAFHEIACDRTSFNLDPWAMSDQRIQDLAHSKGTDFFLVEAMMGLFDGAADGSGSAADLAAQLHMPIVLVVDAAKQSHSIAALVGGFKNHRADLEVAGVILNKVGSERHAAMLRSALQAIDVPVLGAVPRSDELVLPERHLGLIQACEIADIEGFIETASNVVERHCDLDALARLFSPIKAITLPENIETVLPLGARIAIAKDAAFSFIYPHLLEDWKRNGVEVSFFSPLADEAPNDDVDAVFLPGGYPELHCETLGNAKRFQAGMHAAKTRGVQIHGECGGYMVLGEAIIDKAGKSHAMLGMLGLVTSFEKRKLHLGYRNLKGVSTLFEGARFSAHEFHYTSALKEEGQPLFEATDALGESVGKAGLSAGNVSGSYMHLIDRRVR